MNTSGFMEETDYQAQLHTHLEEAIDELREKSEREIEDYKTSVENSYRDKVGLEYQTQLCAQIHDACTLYVYVGPCCTLEKYSVFVLLKKL